MHDAATHAQWEFGPSHREMKRSTLIKLLGKSTYNCVTWQTPPNPVEAVLHAELHCAAGSGCRVARHPHDCDDGSRPEITTYCLLSSIGCSMAMASFHSMYVICSMDPRHDIGSCDGKAWARGLLLLDGGGPNSVQMRTPNDPVGAAAAQQRSPCLGTFDRVKHDLL